MRLSHLIKPEEIISPEALTDMEIGKPVFDLQQLSKKDLVFCEADRNAADFAKKASDQGASAIVTTYEGVKKIGTLPIPVIEVENVRKSYSLAWCRYENEPSRDLRLIAITGTNGKTSVASFLHTLLNAAGIPTGLIGTVEYTAGETHLHSSYTTPPPDILYPLLRSMKESGMTTVVMEASSHAIAQHRLYGLHFVNAVFTNLSRDHLDYHKTWEAYRDTKALLFANADNAVINLGDKQAHYMGFAATGNVYYYGRKPEAEFYIENPLCDGKTIRYSLQTETDTVEICFPAVGDFHVENSAAAIACALLEGVPPKTIEDSVKYLHTPSGRMERIPLDTDFSVYIDYAHSPEALEKALTSLRPLTSKLTVLFGAGGDRDKGKRPEMGAIAETLADLVILTNDNPRGESPENILDDIEKGMKKQNHLRVPDRKDAILLALKQAESGEILLLAGKGHENYTIDQNGKHTFSEKEIIKNALGSS